MTDGRYGFSMRNRDDSDDCDGISHMSKYRHYRTQSSRDPGYGEIRTLVVFGTKTMERGVGEFPDPTASFSLLKVS